MRTIAPWLVAEIESVTPSWLEGPPRLPKRRRPLDDDDITDGAFAEETEGNAVKRVAPSAVLMAAVLAELEAAPAGKTVKEIADASGFKFAAVYQVVMRLLQAKKIHRALSDRDHRWRYQLV